MRIRLASLRFCLVLLGLVATLPAAAEDKVGVNAAVNTDANGLPPGGTVRRLVIGQEIVHNERITTDAKGQTQILFLDGSSVSIGPNADLLIDEFVYDPSTGTGKMTLTEIQGAMRFVGGKLSKQDNAVTVHLGTATIGVRGGVFVADVHPGGKTDVIFVYGKAVSVSGQSGCSQQLYRPGFEVTIGGPGGCPDNPHAAPPDATSAILAQLDGRAGGNGGVSNGPTDQGVANSPVGNTISGAIGISIAQANANNPANPSLPPPTTGPPPGTPPLNTVASQPVVAANQKPPPSVAQPFPNTANISGGLNFVATADPTVGFHNQVIPYSGASVQNGVLVITVGDQSASIPLLQGTNTFTAGGTYSPAGPIQGKTVVTPDNTFFYGNLTAVNNPGSSIFIYGGTPVNTSAYLPPSSPTFLAFQIQPDTVLNSPIPFTTNSFGGSIASPTVSPLYIAVSPSIGFDYQVTGSGLSKALQASLGINGTGAAQSSTIMVGVGNIFASGLPVLNGVAEGMSTPSATGPSTLVSTAYITPSDGTGASFYGGNTVSGFVLQPTCCAGLNAGSFPPAAINLQSGQVSNYNFNQPATSIATPAIANGPQTTQTLSGYAGGIMTSVINNGTAPPYALVGATAIATDATNLQIAAAIAGTDPFTPAVSGTNSMLLSYGSLSPGNTNGRQGYINDNLFGVLESPGGAGSSLNNTNGNANIYLVTNTAVPGAINSILPANVSPCACQYLQWGYWGGQLTTSTDGGGNRVDYGAINTWVAGTPTVTMPTSGTGSYSGAAIGTVATGGATYVAAGGFSSSYNFGSNTGMVTISNFDGHTFGGSVVGSAGTYAGAISGSGLSGTTAGSFYGPGAAETGGQFSVQNTGGPSYIAAGTYAGKLTGPITPPH